MLQLTKDDIYLDQQADNKQDAIKKVANALTQRQFVEEGYVDGMLERESQAATFLGSGIAIPHGTTKTRHLVKKTGVQVFYFPQGVQWGDDDEKAYIAIGIAASSDEHLTLLRQLTHVLGDEDIEDRIKQIKTKDDVIQLLSGQNDQTETQSLITNDLLSSDVTADSIDTLKILNASKLKRFDAVNSHFITHLLDQKPTYLGQGVWLSDSKDGNLKNAIAVSRTSSQIQEAAKDVKVLITASLTTQAIDNAIARLAELAYKQQLAQLHVASYSQISEFFTSDKPINEIFTFEQSNTDEASIESDTLSAEFVVLNPHGLHTRPASVLVKTVKQFECAVTIANLDGTGNAVSATSLMKIVALGAKKGSRLKITATGSDAKQALETIGQAISNGLGEGIE